MDLRTVNLRAALALLLFSFATAAPAFATHFRFAHNTWRRVSGNTVEFTSTQAWRANSLDMLRITPGDGSSSLIGPVGNIGTVTDLAGEQYTIRQYTVQHTYTTEGPFTAFSTSCCRISTLVNAADQAELIQAVVDLRSGNQGSPVSSIPVILQMIQGGTNSVALPVADPDGDTISCRMASSAESSIPTLANAGGHTIAVSPDCTLSWDTGGTSVGQKYAVQVIFEEDHAGNTSSVALDFIVEIVGGTLNTSPECNGTSGQHLVNVGQPFTGNFTGTDVDGDSLMVSHLGLPPGATLSPPSGTTSTQPFASTFSWTPQAADAGSARAVTIVYSDPDGLQDTCSFSLRVPLCGDGLIDPNSGEQCDPGAQPIGCNVGDTCTPSCVCVPCGNGVVDAGEQCDDGNTQGGDCCSSACQFEAAGATCADDGDQCTQDVCGAGPDQGSCTHPPANPAPSQCQQGCGNGILEAPEQCDDGNTQGGDCCDASCMFESGVCDDGNSCTADGVCLAGLCAPGPIVLESRACNACEDGIDNDSAGGVDFEDPACSTFAEMARFAIIAADQLTRTAGRLGRRVSAQSVPAGDPSLPFPLGPSVAGVCGGGMSLRSGFDIGLLAASGKVRFNRSTPRDLAGDVRSEIATNGAKLVVRDQGPLVGPTVCSDDRTTPCTSAADCSAGTCSVRLHMTQSPNPFVTTDGSSDNYGLCVASLSSLTALAQQISSYVPAPSERVSLTTACAGCAATDQIRAKPISGDVIVTLGGGLQVLDVDRVHLSGRARLRVQGQDDTVLVVRVSSDLRMGARAAVILESNGAGLGSLSTDRVLWVVEQPRSRASLGPLAQFAGTLLHTGRRGIRIGSAVTVDGAAFGQRVRIGNLSTVLHTPFTPLLPLAP